MWQKYGCFEINTDSKDHCCLRKRIFSPKHQSNRPTLKQFLFLKIVDPWMLKRVVLFRASKRWKLNAHIFIDLSNQMKDLKIVQLICIWKKNRQFQAEISNIKILPNFPNWVPVFGLLFKNIFTFINFIIALKHQMWWHSKLESVLRKYFLWQWPHIYFEAPQRE